MSYLTLLRLLDVSKWIFVSILFLVIDTYCVKGWKGSHQIFVPKEDKFTASIMFISCIVCFGWHCYILCQCLLVLYLFDSHLLIEFSFFCFYKHFFVTIHLYYLHFPHCWVSIILLFVVVFLISTWTFPLLLFGFLIFWFFKKKLTTIHLRWFNKMYHSKHDELH